MFSRRSYKKFIRSERREHFITPYDLAYEAFITLGYDQQSPDFFYNHASEFVERMRRQCWESFIPYERDFSVRMITELIDSEEVHDMAPEEAIEHFVAKNMDQIYELSLSNTQSRRSRAGKEFEAILELLLIGANLSFDAQGAVGKQKFELQGLGKLVDFVSPGVVQYRNNKRNTALISAKTTLRERWQEVPEEVSRTGSREMYLATVDDGITKETVQTLYEANVIIVLPAFKKEEGYADDQRVITYEEMLETVADCEAKWDDHAYGRSDLEAMKENILEQIDKHEKHPYVQRFYLDRLKRINAEIAAL